MDAENRPITPPQRYESPPWPDRRCLTRDKRLQVKALHSAGYSQREIAKQLEIGRHAVRTAIHSPPIPRKRCGRPSSLDDDQKRMIIDWVCSLKECRRASWEQIASQLEMPDRTYAIRNVLRKEGFARRIARRKPPYSEPNR
jgi:transposase